jgi:hypothetical protein
MKPREVSFSLDHHALGVEQHDELEGAVEDAAEPPLPPRQRGMRGEQLGRALATRASSPCADWRRPRWPRPSATRIRASRRIIRSA